MSSAALSGGGGGGGQYMPVTPSRLSLDNGGGGSPASGFSLESLVTPPPRHRSIPPSVSSPAAAAACRTPGVGPIPETLLNSAFHLSDRPPARLPSSTSSLTGGGGDAGVGSPSANPQEYIKRLEEENALISEELQASYAELTEMREMTSILQRQKQEGDDRLQSILNCIYEQNTILDQCCGQMDFLRALFDESPSPQIGGGGVGEGVDASLYSSTDDENESEKTPEEISQSCVRKLTRLGDLLKRKLKEDKDLRDEVKRMRDELKTEQLNNNVLRLKLEAESPSFPDSSRQVAHKYEALLRAKEAELVRLRDQLQQSTRNNNIAIIQKRNREEVSALQLRLTQLAEEKRRVEEGRRQLGIELAQARSNITSKLDHVTLEKTQLEADRHSWQTRCHELEDLLKSVKEATDLKIKDMAVALVVADNFKIEAEELRRRAEEKVQSISNEMSSVQSSLDHFNKQFLDTQKSLERERDSHQNEIDSLQKEIQQLKSQIDSHRCQPRKSSLPKTIEPKFAKSPSADDLLDSPPVAGNPRGRRNSVKAMVSSMEGGGTPADPGTTPTSSRRNNGATSLSSASSPLLPNQKQSGDSKTGKPSHQRPERTTPRAQTSSSIEARAAVFCRSPLNLKINDIVVSRSGPQKHPTIVGVVPQNGGGGGGGGSIPANGSSTSLASQDSSGTPAAAAGSTASSPTPRPSSETSLTVNAASGDSRTRKATLTGMVSGGGGAGDTAAAAASTESDALKALMTKGSHVSVRNALLDWCKTTTNGYSKVDVTNFSSSWSDGLAFCALLHTVAPDKVPFGQLTADKKNINFEIARNAAESLGINFDLDVAKVMNVERPDWKLILPIVRKLFDCIASREADVCKT